MEEQNQHVADEGQSTSIPISDLMMTVWQQRRRLTILTGVGLLVSIVIVFLIPNQYQSTAQLMPPDPQTFSRNSLLNSLTGGGLMLPSMGGGLLNSRTAADTAIGVLTSQTVQDDIINRFDLRKAYRCKLYIDAREKLTERSTFSENKKSGIITIVVLDRDRNRARNIAEAYIEDLDRLANSLSTSSARRERIFLEGRLASIKTVLDSSAQALSQFSSKNATLDLPMQSEATLSAAGRLQSELIAAQTQLSELATGETSENPMFQQVQGRVDELQRQLTKMTGTEENLKTSDPDSGHELPSVRRLPLLGVTYYDLSRKVTIEQTLYETLTKQYELAKVQEAQEIPPIKVLDPPDVPEKKSSPHRLAIVFAGTWLTALVGISWIILLRYQNKSSVLHA